MPRKSASTKKAAGTTELFKCTCCGLVKNQKTKYYQSNSILYRENNNRLTVCKDCVVNIYNIFLDKFNNIEKSVFYVCRLLDAYYDKDLVASVIEQAKNQNSNVIQIYFQKINSMTQYAGYTFSESNVKSDTFDDDASQDDESIVLTDQDKKNRNDVIRLLGYDPFEFENEIDKKYLYNSLVDFLDESTLEDSFKLPAVIEIVKSFNQINKINQALADITSDINRFSSNVGGVKSLIDAKDKMLRAVLALAKDNGISVNHSNNKSKGAGTLSGIIKQLQERGFTEAAVNLFDIETAKGIKQVADLSNESIIKQLQFDENDYTEMITEQRELIKDLSEKNAYLEEENRKLKIEMMKYHKNNNGDDNGG